MLSPNPKDREQTGNQMSRAKGCVFHRIRQQFDAEDNQALNTLLNTKGHVEIAREMTGAGYYMSEHAVRRHKRGDCTCNLVGQ
jgi:hypothetical protein